MIKKIFSACLVLFPVFLEAQSDLFKHQTVLLNTRIDSVAVSHFLLNEPAQKDFSKKFKVLEFWATWCNPCLKAVPHLNRLQKSFADSNIIFLSITYEPPAKTYGTLKKVKFETIVASDTTRSIHKKLRIDFNGTMVLPRTVLVDDENRIVWFGNPNKLNHKMIEQFLRKEPVEE